MGQTLTHGIYLPDEGERNCYNGLAANWQLLDGAVGTVAAHTAALAGKAPLVHTHGKADITDLFNSANTWSGLNSYNQSIQITANFNIGAAPSSDVYGGFNFGNGTTNIGNITSRINSVGATYSRLYIGNKFANGALDPNGTWKYVELQVGLRANGDRFIYTDGSWRNSLIPYDSTVSIGDSTHQWNNLYAKNYFYNGVAWGLDQANAWTGENIFNYDLLIKNANATQGTAPSSNKTWTLTFCDSNKATTGQLYCQYRTNGSIYLPLRINNGTYDYRLNFILDAVGYAGFNPSVSGIINLGSSNYKWKTLNGINPGALSLPDFANTDPIDFRQWDVTGAVNVNFYTPTVNGWLNISIWDRATNSIFVYRSGKERVGVFGNGSMASDGRLALLMPVQANATYVIIIKASANSDIYAANFFPCLGNV